VDDVHAPVRGATRIPRRWLFRFGLPAVVIVTMIISTVPSFFSTYRFAAFDTVPRDDYAPYLLALVGELGPEPHRNEKLFEGAPMAYRMLSVAVAVPAYQVLPYYAFSNLEDPDEPYLRASAALALVSYVSVLLTILAVYLIARRRLACSRVASILVACFAYPLFDLVSTVGVDALAVLIIALLILFLDRPVVFVPLVVISAGVNEKIVLIFLILTGMRTLVWLVRHRTARGYPLWPQTLASIVGAAVYVAIRRFIIPLPGWENQLDPLTWPSTFVTTLMETLSLKGLATNGVTLVVMAGLVAVAWLMARRLGDDAVVFRRSDVSVAVALLVISFSIGMGVTAGRLVAHAFPLYLPMVALLIDLYVGARVLTKPPPSAVRGKRLQAAGPSTPP
jgi:hypothetical protein